MGKPHKESLKFCKLVLNQEDTILMIIPNLDFGGAQRDFCKVANGLSRSYNVEVVTFTKVEVPFDLIPEVHFMEIYPTKSIFHKLTAFWKRVQYLKRFKKERNITASISYLEGANYINALSKVSDRIIISARGSVLFDETIRRIIGFFRKKILIPILYNKADDIVVLNNGIKDELYHSLGVKKPSYSTISNGYDIDEITKMSGFPLNNFCEDFFTNPVILAAGRLAPEKGYKYLIDVYGKAKSKIPDLKLAFIGNGPLKSDLINYSEKMGLKVFTDTSTDNALSAAEVAFFGYQANPYAFISRASLFAITSSSEGGPNVLLEAMSCKTLVLSVDCPTGPRERIAPNTIRPKTPILKAEVSKYGVLLPMLNTVDNESAIREWVGTIFQFSDEKNRKSIIDQAFTYVTETYSENAINRIWLDLLSR